MSIESLSFNQPKFCASATWNPDAITFANSQTIGTQPNDIFVSINNTVYVAENSYDRVQIWLEGNTNPSKTISNNLIPPHGLFVSVTNDIYIDNSVSGYGVEKWTMTSTSGTNVMITNDICFHLFIDKNNTLYCSYSNLHQVVKTSLNNNHHMSTNVAGTGNAGSASNMLSSPNGIFADAKFNLYVADSGNDRIQLFIHGQLNGQTIAGNGANNTITLNTPRAVILDADGYLFISDTFNHRIVASSANGFRCIVGCSSIAGSAANQLYKPWNIGFDSYGNLFVADRFNNRIQKFLLATNPCGITYNQPKFSSCATWDTNATTFSNNNTIGMKPYSVFVNTNNSIYVSGITSNQVYVWYNGSSSPNRNISRGSNISYSIFVGNNDDLYVDNGLYNDRVDKWSLNATNSSIAMYVNKYCRGIFVDMVNNIYCSIGFLNKVIKKPLNNDVNITTIAAGTGNNGSGSYMLSDPRGIFVDIKFNLYVADCGNNRIQFYRPGNLNGTSLAGSKVPGTITLNCPTDIILDGDGDLFIVDSYNYRIVRSGLTGFQCLFGCTGTSTSTFGSAADQLNRPCSLSFDSDGNIYVADTYNNRIQKLLLATNSCDISYNQPTFCASAVWNSSATNFADNNTIGSHPNSIFLDVNNTIYVSAGSINQTIVWLDGNPSSTWNISGNLIYPHGIFVTNTNDIYIDNGYANGRVEKWKLNGTNGTAVMYVNASCYSLFIDIHDNLYCSLKNSHVVIKKSLHTNANTTVTVAGNGINGSASNMLNMPCGIFIDIAVNLYVADCGNDRVQLMKSGETNGTTINTNTITLSCPTGVILDGDGYLFIVDSNNNRIVGSGANGFRCLVGCISGSSSLTNTLNNPTTLSFDSYGNIFVTDLGNERIQKFFFLNDSCDQITETTETTASITTTPIIQDCSIPIITLIPNTLSLSSPIQFRRNQDFFISSNIQLKCNISLSTIMQWTINNCTSYNCLTSIEIDRTIPTTFSEIYIPSRTLPYGTYRFKLTVTMTSSPNLTSSASTYIKITPSLITANLVQFGTSMITRGYKQDLILDPGTYSVDPDENIFNTSNWNYEYYCRIYGLYNFPNILGFLLTIDDPRIDSSNPSCLSNQTLVRYNGTSLSPNSSIIISSNSLSPNRTYQFMVIMTNRRNSSMQATGYLLVQIDNNYPQMIAIACVISEMCISNLEFQLVNPTTQVALFSVCLGSCSSLTNITWNIYQGFNASLSTIHWTLFNQMIQYENMWFFGYNTSNFTATNDLFLHNPQVTFWRFEVVYTFALETSSSALNFIINQPPRNGSCSINPRNGTTSTLFTITCPNWFDEDGVQDYSIYGYTSDISEQTIIAFSSTSDFQVFLPAGDENTSLLYIIVHIRDTLDCVTEYNMSSIIVQTNSIDLIDFTNTLHNDTDSLMNNPFIQLLSSGNQNIVGQLITSFSQEFNKINTENIQNAVSNGIPFTSIFISPLGNQNLQKINTSLNTSALIEYHKQLNVYANIRDYLITYLTNLVITTSSSIKLQSSTLVQLTQATNQLTRTSSMIASDKCYQLANALYSMSNTISYEDVQTAANQITQCTTNVLTAVNGPLQQRTSVLDLDFSRANTLPQDYDTNLENEWSNLNLFSNGMGFSWETIETGRNIYYQKQLANTINIQATETMTLLTNALNIHINIGQNFLINTSSVFMSLETISIESLSNKSIKPIQNSRIYIPSNIRLNTATNSSISIRSMIQPLASTGNSQNTNLSTSLSFTILDQNGNEISIPSNNKHMIELIIPRDSNLIIPPMTLQNISSFNSTPHRQLFNLHFIDITSVVSISIHFEMHPLDTSLAYLLIYKFDSSPQLNSTMKQIDGWSLLCPSNLTVDDIYLYFIDNNHTIGHQSIIFGLRELNSTDDCLNQSISDPPISNEPFHFTADYELRIYTSGCYYLDTSNTWQSNGLLVGSLTNHYQTQCFSTHLTTFAGGFIVLPSPINWNNVFSNADFMKNKTIYITVICICILYLVLIIYARYKDKKDIEKLGITPLSDNHKTDQYYYEIIIFTGHRIDAGTQSKVYFILAGNDNETSVRRLIDPHREILQRGGIDAFVMSVPKSLGLLNYIRIWHDNSGKGTSASWFLKYIIVRDLQTMEKSYFICQNWLAVEKGDGLIERILPYADESQKNQFSYLLSKQAYHSMSEGHLWFSIFSRPPSNKFTRVQRCTCCFVLLFTAMLLNILYYDQTNETNTNQTDGSLSFGPLHISSQQIGIGIIVEILSFFPSILLVQFFRRINPRNSHNQASSLRDAIYKIKQQKQPISEKEIIKSNKNKRLSLNFPWWCLFIAYGLSFLLTVVSIFFIIVRGIEFGDLKIQKWLTSLLTGFFSSIFFIQPLKVISLTVIFAFFIRNTDKEAGEYIDNDDNLQLDANEDYLHTLQNDSPFTNPCQTRINSLNQSEIAWARTQRLKEIQMWSIIREIITYITFLSLLYIVTYSNMNQNGFYQVNHFRKFFLNTRQNNYDYTKISTVHQYWSWLENNFLENIHAQQWYNGEPPRNLSGFINDRSNRLIGWPTMRQLRVKSYSCFMNSTCQYDYNFFHEEKQSYQPGWKNQTTDMYNVSIEQAFQYQTGDQLGTYLYVGIRATYASGGYVYEFRGSLNDIKNDTAQLQRLNWIDSQTRAVIIQVNLYNPNSQLFISVNLLTEFLSTGGIDVQSSFQPISFQRIYLVFTSLSTLICAIFYMIFIIYIMINEIKSLIKLKINYFRNFWSFIELGLIICSWTIIGIYIWRYQEFSRIGELFQKTHGYVYINLERAVYINDIFIYLLAFSCFFGTIKFARLCRFNYRLLLFTKTLQYASNELLSFAFMSSIIYVAFITLFYLLFVSKISTCSTLLHTAQMLFEMTLMKFDAHEFTDAAAFLGPFCFSLFIIIVVFICMSMFLTIINDNFRTIRNNKKLNQDENQQIFSFMFYKFQNWMGLGGSLELEQFEKHDGQMRSKYFDPVEHFPDKIDQLLNALNRV
ncbi:unnamed protein product [Adineta steineri]|uniref:PLAT domain-containing protein n=1 Tax=Adineta steineri TaxID=433720 RepID=A0A814LZ01_9BILA|nr:unnamed protein product [Adineta steineri]